MELRTLSPVNVGQVEYEKTDGGTPVAKFGVALNTQDRSGNEMTVWTNAKCYGYLAKMMHKNDAGGRRVTVTGKMEYWEYQGEEYSVLQVHEIRFLDAKGQSGGGGFDQSQGSNDDAFDQTPPSEQPADSGGGDQVFEPDDEMPF